MGLSSAGKGLAPDGKQRIPPPSGLLTTPEGAEEDADLQAPAPSGDVAVLCDNDDSSTPMFILPEFTSQKSSGLAPVVKRRSVREAGMASPWQEVEVAPFACPVTGKQVMLRALVGNSSVCDSM